jgi:hypothetical protein
MSKYTAQLVVFGRKQAEIVALEDSETAVEALEEADYLYDRETTVLVYEGIMLVGTLDSAEHPDNEEQWDGSDENAEHRFSSHEYGLRR